jgi:sugar phosphate isomerase/epimerase
MDLGPESPEVIRQVTAAGLKIGTVDLARPWESLACGDAARRNLAADHAAIFIKASVAAGARTFFVIAFPDDPTRKRSASLTLAAKGYGRLCQAIAGTGAKIAIEGYPGSAPYFSALACTPEGYRTFFDAVGSDVLGVNFDPSHLVRMGIDPVRFLGEFAPRVWHVHAKDAVINAEELYQFGNLQPANLARPHGWGGYHWRYAVPGAGGIDWPTLLRMLKEAGYKGSVSVELEDENFNGTEEGEKQGLIAARDYLAGA